MEFGQGTDLDPVLIDHPNGWKCLYVCIRDEPFLKPIEEEPVSCPIGLCEHLPGTKGHL
jgi:hypothetical protein